MIAKYLCMCVEQRKGKRKRKEASSRDSSRDGVASLVKRQWGTEAWANEHPDRGTAPITQAIIYFCPAV
jgi:hypothetical protein